MITNTTLNNFVIFTIGAAIGSAVTCKIVKDKYERLAQEEIDSVKKVFSVKKEKEETEEEKDEEEIKEEVKSEYAAKVKEYGYSPDDEEDDEDMDKPYVISPNEYDELGYKTVSLEYFEDGVLLNEQGKIIKNADDLIGIDPSEHFGEYEEDSVFVRNDRLRTDYEILKREGLYSEEY